MMLLKIKNLKFMLKIKNTITILLLVFVGNISAQEAAIEVVNDAIPDTTMVSMTTDSLKSFKRIKLDGVAAVVGDYLIL